MPDLVALPYHREVVAHLQRQSPAVWRHFASDVFGAAHASMARLDLLKTTYALERASHPEVYAIADEVAEGLGLGVPIALYQGADGPLNAALIFLPEVASVVFQGPVVERLDRAELRALLAHELAHHRLWRLEEGAYLCAARVLSGLLGGQVQRSVAATHRLYTLSTEMFADRAALIAGGDLDAAVRLLVKVNTGLAEVVAADFIAQARTVWEAAGDGSASWSHPETYVRALALAWFAEEGEAAEARIRALVEGKVALSELDILRREELTAWTRALVDGLLQPGWFRTDATLGHGRLLFDDYAVPDVIPDWDALRARLALYGPTVLDYAAFLLIDFVAVDPSLADVALARAHQIAELLGIEARFELEVHKKLKRTKKSVKEIVARRAELLAQAEVQVAG